MNEDNVQEKPDTKELIDQRAKEIYETWLRENPCPEEFVQGEDESWERYMVRVNFEDPSWKSWESQRARVQWGSQRQAAEEYYWKKKFDASAFDPPLDQGIAKAVLLLRLDNVETYESCEGGPGHSFPEPTIRFHGNSAEGMRALSVAMRFKLPIASLRRVWQMIDDEPTGPTWEMTFSRKVGNSRS